MHNRLELAGLVAALLLIGVFVVSFVLGLGAGRAAPEVAAPDPQEANVADPPPTEGRVRVEVLNGSGKAGLARAATERLRDAGFDVVYFGNAARVADSSVVIARSTDDSNARAVARRLGIRPVRIDPDTTLLLEVTVVLGKDWIDARQ
jgi:hypothetical protein